MSRFFWLRRRSAVNLRDKRLHHLPRVRLIFEAHNEAVGKPRCLGCFRAMAA